MLEISPKIVTDVGLSVTDVANYLIQHGWQQVTSQNDRLQVFQGINDDLGNPIILPLPINDSFIDTPLRLSEAVNLSPAPSHIRQSCGHDLHRLDKSVQKSAPDPEAEYRYRDRAP